MVMVVVTGWGGAYWVSVFLVIVASGLTARTTPATMTRRRHGRGLPWRLTSAATLQWSLPHAAACVEARMADVVRREEARLEKATLRAWRRLARRRLARRRLKPPARAAADA